MATEPTEQPNPEPSRMHAGRGDDTNVSLLQHLNLVQHLLRLGGWQLLSNSSLLTNEHLAAYDPGVQHGPCKATRRGRAQAGAAAAR
jgi:hypothetical protein